MEVNVHILDVFEGLLCLLLCFDWDEYKKVDASALWSPHYPTQVFTPAYFSASDSLFKPSRYSFSTHPTFLRRVHLPIICTMSSFTSSRFTSRASSVEQSAAPVVRNGGKSGNSNSGSSQSNIKNGASSTGAVFF